MSDFQKSAKPENINLQKGFNDYAKELESARTDKNIRTAISRAVKAYRETTDSTMARYPQTPGLAAEVREIKTNAVAHQQELLKQAMESVERNHGKAFFAKDKEEAPIDCERNYWYRKNRSEGQKYAWRRAAPTGIFRE